MIKIKKGLNLPILGEPKQQVTPGPTIRTVAVIGEDYVGMKPTMLVKEGDKVLKGQPLFEDKKNSRSYFYFLPPLEPSERSIEVISAPLNPLW